jgi:hypothetical protein
MDTKLTLKLDKDIIKQAKTYAQNKQQSLSALVENYFRFLLDQEQTSSMSEISPVVRELSGIIQLDDEIDIHEEYTDYLLKKYR